MSPTERATGKHRLSVDASRCMGHGRCAAVTRGLFELDPETDRSSPTCEVIDDADLEAARRAVRACPESAVRLSDD